MRLIVLASILLLAPLVNAEEILVPKTTVLTLALDRELEAKKLKKGKEFKAHLSEPVRGDAGQVIIPAGSEVKGKVEDADERHLELKFKRDQNAIRQEVDRGADCMGRCRKCKD